MITIIILNALSFVGAMATNKKSDFLFMFCCLVYVATLYGLYLYVSTK